jgi:hypothetical protein
VDLPGSVSATKKKCGSVSEGLLRTFLISLEKVIKEMQDDPDNCQVVMVGTDTTNFCT